VALRLAHVASRPGIVGLSGPKTLQLICNSLIDNFTEGYDLLNQQFENPQEGDPVSIDPESNCATTTRPLNFLTAAGKVFRVPEQSQIRFGLRRDLEGLVPPGVLTGFTNPQREIYSGRCTDSQRIYYGYDNISSQDAGSYHFYAYSPLLDVSEPLEVWLGSTLQAVSGRGWDNALFNQTLTGGETNPLGDGPFSQAAKGTLSPAANYREQRYGISIDLSLPGKVGLWQIIRGVQHVDKTLTDNNKHYIITIPREGGLPPYQVFYDRIRGFYYTFNCLSGQWQRTNKADLGIYLGAQNLVDAYNRTKEIIDDLIHDGHFVLDVLGMVPIIGSVADIINGAWYFVEGKKLDATLSFVGAIPGIGELAIGAKLAAPGILLLLIKNIEVAEYVKSLKLASGAEYIADFVAFGKKLNDLGIPDDEINAILKNLDEASDADLVAKFFDNPEDLASAWDIAYRAGLGPGIRFNLADLDKILSYQITSGKLSDDIVQEIESSAITAGGSVRSWLDIVPIAGGVKIGARGDYAIRENAEVFYRGLSEGDFQFLLNTGKLRYTSETFTSPSLEYIKAIGYGENGKIIKFYTNNGTLEALEKIGVRNDDSERMMSFFSDMPHVTSVNGWTKNNAMFKTEGSTLPPPIGPTGQINIGLGKGTAIDIFNQNIKAFEVVK
jgi:hypothetical protein